MDAIETETIDQNGHTYRIAIYADPDASNPLDDWSETGTILSLDRVHRRFDSDEVESAIQKNPDAVVLNYIEHGCCRWAVVGEMPAGANCTWDSVAFAGVWIPDAETLASAKNYGGSTRRHFMRKRAREACEAYTRWCNGEVYGYDIDRVTTCAHCGEESKESLDSCWGFYGLDYCRSEAKAIVEARSEPPGAVEIHHDSD
jgi:hypothetical protein